MPKVWLIGMQDRVDNAYSRIDEDYEAGTITEATYQFCADILQICDPSEQDDENAAQSLIMFSEMDLDSLMEWRAGEIAEFRSDLTFNEYRERFAIGSTYDNEKDLLENTQWDYVMLIVIPLLRSS